MKVEQKELEPRAVIGRILIGMLLVVVVAGLLFGRQWYAIVGPDGVREGSVAVAFKLGITAVEALIVGVLYFGFRSIRQVIIDQKKAQRKGTSS